MPNAVLTSSVVAPNLVQLSIADGITTAMLAAGFTLIDTVNGTTEIRGYRYNANPSATKGMVYLRLGVTSNQINIQMGDNYTVGTSTIANSLLAGNIGFTNTAPLNLIAVNHPEIRGVFITNTTGNGMIGYIRPATKYSWWDENFYVYAFLPAITNQRINCLPLGFCPFSTVGYAVCDRLRDLPPGGVPQIVKSPLLIGMPAAAVSCIWGQFSSDIASVPGLNQSLLTEYTSGSDNYKMIYINNLEFNYLGVKV